MLPDRRKHGLEVDVSVKDQAVHERGKALVLYVPQATDALSLRDHIIVQVFQV